MVASNLEEQRNIVEDIKQSQTEPDQQKMNNFNRIKILTSIGLFILI